MGDFIAVLNRLRTNVSCGHGDRDDHSLHAVFGGDLSYMSVDHKYDHLWEDLGAKDLIVKLPDEKHNGELRPGSISMFHQLHCLSSLRHAIQQAREGEDPGLDWQDNDHWPHCMDYLRKTLLCWADDLVERQFVFDNGTVSSFIDGAQDHPQANQLIKINHTTHNQPRENHSHPTMSSETPTTPSTAIPWETLESYLEAFKVPEEPLSLADVKPAMQKIAHEARYSDVFDGVDEDLFTGLFDAGRITADELDDLFATFDERAEMREQATLVLSLLEEVKGNSEPTAELREKADELHQVFALQVLHAEWLVLLTIWSAFLEPDVIPQLIADARRFPETPLVVDDIL
ncbi:hypothetical protein GQX73_g2248 [Xylaria multiplex]|uniref:Uncharacterized protein n=1 Tax=Xylaria multiplex TaxID=323545 RepID=A0A7C8MY09_9PEZI|nr:hypothetical protein GQX73_g2248 [Xylaria multiplex]